MTIAPIRGPLGPPKCQQLEPFYSTPSGTRLHITFKVDLNDVIASVERLRDGYLPGSTGSGPEIDEPRWRWWGCTGLDTVGLAVNG
jgi:hypothetical protein